MIVSATYTHRGWFGFCPVYLGGLTTECPSVMPRHYIFDPLLTLVCALCDAADWALEKINPNGPGLQVGFLVTDELDNPITKQHEVDE